MLQLYNVETDLIDHCVLRCSHCSTASPYLPSRIYDLEQFKRDIDALSPVVHIRNLQIVGGEPFLVSNLIEYIRVIRASGISDHVTVITNGVLLDTVNEEILTALDWIYVTFYPDLSPPMLDQIRRGVERAKGIMDTMDHRAVWVTPKSDFFMTEFHGRLDESTLARVWSQCWQKTCTSISDGYVYRCTAGSRRRRYFSAINVDFDQCLLDPTVNGCIIHGPDLENRLQAYLESHVPLPMCRCCTGCSGQSISHRLMTKEEVENPVINTDLSTLLI